VNKKKLDIKKEIEQVFEKTPIDGVKKVHQQLLENGVNISLNSVTKYRKELGLKAVLAVKQVTMTVPRIIFALRGFRDVQNVNVFI